jgi:hypothetical protein
VTSPQKNLISSGENPVIFSTLLLELAPEGFKWRGECLNRTFFLNKTLTMVAQTFIEHHESAWLPRKRNETYAGNAGKGFAVVASEVKSLANQTAKATDEIGQQIGQIQNATKETVAAIQGIGKIIGEINNTSTAIAAGVEEQGSATKEIARNVHEAATGTKEVTTNITGVSQGAGETGAAAMQVLGAADSLSQQAKLLSNEVQSFIQNAKAIP